MATALDVRSAQGAPAEHTHHRAAHRSPKVTQWQVIRSEWIKFWSLRSTPITLISAVVVFVGMGMLASLISTNADVTQMHAEMSGGQSGFAGISGPTEISLSGLNLAQLVFGTLGVLFMAGEYSTGMIRATLTAVPKRLPVLWAKIAVLGVVVFAVTLAAAFVAFFGGQLIIGDGGATLSDPGALRAVIGAAVYMTGGAVIGLALGALLRSSPAAIATLFGIMFLLEGIATLLLPQAWQDDVIKFLPSAAGSAVGAVTPGPFNLEPGPALAVFAGYLVAFALAAAWRLKHHDA